MARRRRYRLPGATYHIMLRGNGGERIFFQDEDCCRMCFLIQEGVERYGHCLLGYCFMTNHLHLAIQVGQISLSRIKTWLFVMKIHKLASTAYWPSFSGEVQVYSYRQ